MRRLVIPVLILLIGAATLWQQNTGKGPSVPAPRADGIPGQPAASLADFPAEAWATLDLIERGGPFPYGRDGSVFRNREGHLPAAERGYYREYTVPTPGATDRGARRLVSGGTPPTVWYYTDDHYRSFRPIDPEDRH